MNAPAAHSDTPAEKKQARNFRLGLAACYLMGFLSLAFAVYETRTLRHLIRDGARADAVIVEIDVGARGSKKAVFRFATERGEDVTARDVFQMHFIRQHVGDAVTALYDPADPTLATIDRGRWTWLEPGILYFGFVVLFGLGMLLPRGRRRAPTPTVDDA